MGTGARITFLNSYPSGNGVSVVYEVEVQEVADPKQI